MPRTLQPLSNSDEQRIKKNWSFLKEELHQDEIRDAFMDEDIWDVKDFDEIDAMPTPNKKNEVFLRLLLKSGPGAYKVFVDALKAKHSDHILEKLKNTPITENKQAAQVDHFAKLTDAQKSHYLTEQNLLKFNKCFGSDVEIVGKALLLTQSDIDVIRMENPYSAITQIHKIILRWKYKNGRNATLGELTRCFMDAENAGARVDWDKFDQGVNVLTQNM
ncbi:death domain-containing protein CRADD-like [Saccostrea echinata]|uniref:death domain-containing protein CRADD-like n=1 Tax=Saccostrea echinata TaxID=191078 RepID=UPI002A7F1C08|nr:death domain-containing protein CRADD-like [Saccostrea echinata]XP_061187824.1 death domain-containing protein CRADD-like [Saccostrea echinata]